MDQHDIRTMIIRSQNPANLQDRFELQYLFGFYTQPQFIAEYSRSVPIKRQEEIISEICQPNQSHQEKLWNCVCKPLIQRVSGIVQRGDRKFFEAYIFSLVKIYSLRDMYGLALQMALVLMRWNAGTGVLAKLELILDRLPNKMVLAFMKLKDAQLSRDLVAMRAYQTKQQSGKLLSSGSKITQQQLVRAKYGLDARFSESMVLGDILSAANKGDLEEY